MSILFFTTGAKCAAPCARGRKSDIIKFPGCYAGARRSGRATERDHGKGGADRDGIREKEAAGAGGGGPLSPHSLLPQQVRLLRLLLPGRAGGPDGPVSEGPGDPPEGDGRHGRGLPGGHRLLRGRHPQLLRGQAAAGPAGRGEEALPGGEGRGDHRRGQPGQRGPEGAAYAAQGGLQPPVPGDAVGRPGGAGRRPPAPHPGADCPGSGGRPEGGL